MRDAGVAGETALLETENTTHSIARCPQRYAVQMHADLVVRGRLVVPERLVLGSVAEAFLRHSMCPVLLVRPMP
ncbi:universal stress protein [Caballeronia sp. AZ1_KS37]|uniref:universal stress protein n=1 Tax=Caballeronia sp. AZ1_KS37 TaxID=2921756 RepID=UPI0032EDE3F5